jgi:hypothetical protein
MSRDLELFIKNYFAVADKYITEHKKFLEKFDDGETDYLILKPILIDQALSFLHSIDSSFPKKELNTEIKALNEMYAFYIEMKKKSELLEVFFYDSYLHNNTEYRKIYEEIQAINAHIKYLENSMKKIDLKSDNKHTKTMYANMVTELDSIRVKRERLHKELKKIEQEKKDEFFKVFPEKLQLYIQASEYVLNVMIMILSQLIWLKARESLMIKDFFKKINKKISMELYLADYLKKNPLHKKPKIREELQKLIKT